VSQDDIVHDLSPFYIPYLLFGDDMSHNGFESVSYYLRYNFVDDVAKRYGSKLFGICDSFFFRNES